MRLSFTHSQLAQKLSEFLYSEEWMHRAHIGASLIDIPSGQELFAHNSKQYFYGGSIQKIALSLCAINLLPKSFRFETRIEKRGFIDSNGLLEGDLWIIGGGDPTLCPKDLELGINELQKTGLKKISGKIYLDTTHFETARASRYWNFEDIANYYGAGAYGLSFNQNQYHITFKSGSKEGLPAQVIGLDPPLEDLLIHNEVTTGPQGSGDQAFVFGSEYSPLQYYRGSIPLEAETFSIKGALPDPALLIATQLSKAFLPSQGYEIVREKRALENRELLFSHFSPFLHELIQQMNPISDNLIAEHLFKEIGAGQGHVAAKKIQEHLSSLGITCHIQDGAGLAKGNLFTPYSFTKLLRHLRSNSKYNDLINSLATPGKGTLASFPPFKQAELKAKTGSARQTLAIAGYLSTRNNQLDSTSNNQELAFSLFFNHCELENKALQSKLYEWLNLACGFFS